MILKDRMTTQIDGELVVFLIGMRINHWWKIHKWWPVASAMPRMLRELYAAPQSGFLSYEMWFGRTIILVQYWKSFAQLEAYARERNAQHLPAWAEFNKRVGLSGDVGIWHETYIVPPGNHETMYVNMPPFGLGKAGRLIEAINERASAAGRLRGNKPNDTSAP